MISKAAMIHHVRQNGFDLFHSVQGEPGDLQDLCIEKSPRRVGVNCQA